MTQHHLQTVLETSQFLPIQRILEAFETWNTSTQCLRPKHLVSVHLQNWFNHSHTTLNPAHKHLVSVHLQNWFNHSHTTLNPAHVHLYLKKLFRHTAPPWWTVFPIGHGRLTANRGMIHLLAVLQYEIYPVQKSQCF